MRVVQFYQTPSGKRPVEEFLDSVPDQHAQKVVWVLRLVERLAIVPRQYFKKLAGTENLWEIRVQSAGNSYRFLGFFDGTTLIILTNGFSKKKQATPRQEIVLAQKRKSDYFERKNKP